MRLGLGNSVFINSRISGYSIKLYASSINGNDANDGLTEDTAKASLSALSPLMIDGAGVFLERGSHWKEDLTITSENITIKAYGSGNLPTISAGETVTELWTQPDSITYPNVWQASIAHFITSDNRARLTVYENGSKLEEWNTLELVNNNPGSMMCSANGTYSSEGTLVETNPAIVYLHTSNSDNPNSNSNEYLIPVRASCIKIESENNIIEGIQAIYNANDDGSIRGTRQHGNIIRKCWVREGTKHNTVLGGDLIEDSIYESTSGGMITFYSTTGIGNKGTVRRVLAYMSSVENYENFNSNLLLSHAGDLTEYDVITVEQSIVLNDGGIVASGGNTLNVVNSYIENATRITFPNSPFLNINRLSINRYTGQLTAAITNVSGGRDYSINDCNIHINEYIYRTVQLSFGGEFNFTNLSWYNSDRVREFIFSNSINKTIRVNNCVLWEGAGDSFSAIYNVISGDTLSCDYNVYYQQVTGGNPKFRINSVGTTVGNLANWQSVTGQDSNSVYLTVAQAANFWLGDPAQGDYRINPNAQVTGADGTIYIGTFADGITPITQVGQQSHWNFNSRSAVSGPALRWPTYPANNVEKETYLESPASWDFYP